MLCLWWLCATLPSISGAVSLDGGLCFTQGFEAAERRNLMDDGESYPVGFWTTSFDDYGQTSFAATAIAQLVVEEVFGFNTAESGRGTDESEGIYALMGCNTSLLHNQSCGSDNWTATHVLVDAYVDPELWQKVKGDLRAPVKVGSMGYDFYDGQFVSASACDATSEIALDTFEGLHVENEPWVHFDDISSINTSLLGSCENFFLNLSDFGDDADLTTSCPDGYFWLSPACRGNASQCIPYFSPFTDWLDPIITHKAIVWNIPLAVAGANDFLDFEELVHRHRCIFSGQRPSSLYSSKALRIHFPAHDRKAYAAKNYTTAEPGYPISNLISYDLMDLAPELHSFVSKFHLSAAMMTELLQKQSRSFSDNTSWRDVACDFLTSNPTVLQSWLPREVANKLNLTDGEFNASEDGEFNAENQWSVGEDVSLVTVEIMRGGVNRLLLSPVVLFGMLAQGWI